MDDGKVPVLYVHTALWDDLNAWLASRGLKSVRYPEHLQDDPTTTQYFVIPN